MRARLYIVLVAALAASQAVAAAGSEQARQLLDRMTEAARNLNYDGVFVYQHGTDMDAMRIIHKAGPDGERERIMSLTGHAREVIRNDESVTCIFPDDQSVMVEKSRPYKMVSAQLPQPVAQLADNYAFAITGAERVAGRDAHIVRIQPRDNYRYGYRLWLDKDNGMMLRSELINSQGKPLEQFMFTRIEFPDRIPDERLEPTVTGSDYTWYENPDDAHIKMAASGWEVEWLPPGFMISDRADELLANSPRPVHHMVFSDGLAMVSVFVERIRGGRGALIGPSKMGAVNAFARKTEGHQIMVVGEVPLITARRMAQSVAYNPD